MPVSKAPTSPTLTLVDKVPARQPRRQAEPNRPRDVCFRAFGGGKTLCPGRHFCDERDPRGCGCLRLEIGHETCGRTR
ncbi:hypothetical protein GGR53DRAFT_52614 [Hypoxylon sp. FL1150]|nr:hypothetical protein GGR53DRAFT_52614 [Hypoxylon sp. FL1150]